MSAVLSFFMSMSLIRLPQEQYPLVNRFYKANGHKGKARGNETIYVIRDQQMIVAAVRLCPKQEGWLLRSLWVARERRGEGIGSILIKDVMARPEHTPCWCYPYDHLTAFYESAGFILLTVKEAPEDISGPFEAYQKKGNRILLMGYRASSGRQ